MAKPKNPSGRPKGSKNKRPAQGRPRIGSRQNQPCPNLGKPDHGANCGKCGGTGEVKK